MPKGDGTGPLRLRLRGGGLMRLAGSGGKRGLWSLGIPLVAAFIQDMRKPNGYLRPLIERFRKRKPAIRVVDADYERIDDGRKKIEEQ